MASLQTFHAWCLLICLLYYIFAVDLRMTYLRKFRDAYIPLIFVDNFERMEPQDKVN